MRFDLAPVAADTSPYFRDVYDHVIRINEMMDTLRELLTTALEVNLSHLRHELEVHAGGAVDVRLSTRDGRDPGNLQ